MFSNLNSPLLVVTQWKSRLTGSQCSEDPAERGSAGRIQIRTSVMKWFLYAISLIWIAVGCCTILYTSQFRSVVRNLVKSVDQKFLSALPFVAGILFLFSASASRYPWFIRLFGLIGIVKGVFIFLNPKGFYDKSVDWCLDSLTDQTHRFYGIITIILGAAVLSWII